MARPGLLEQVKDSIVQGQSILAMKLLRTETQAVTGTMIGLKEVKEYTEGLKARLMQPSKIPNTPNVLKTAQQVVAAVTDGLPLPPGLSGLGKLF